jgi:hypothetical protein
MAYTHHPVYVVTIFVEVVIAELAHDEQEDHEATGNAYGETQDVDEGEHFLFPEILDCEQQVVFQHDNLVLLCYRKSSYFKGNAGMQGLIYHVFM